MQGSNRFWEVCVFGVIFLLYFLYFMVGVVEGGDIFQNYVLLTGAVWIVNVVVVIVLDDIAEYHIMLLTVDGQEAEDGFLLIGVIGGRGWGSTGFSSF